MDMTPEGAAPPPICKGCAVGGYHVALCQANRDVLAGMEHARLEAERAPVDNSAYARLQRRNSLLVQAATPDPRRPSLSLHSAAAADATAAAAGFVGKWETAGGAQSTSRSAESTTESVRELPSEPPSEAGSSSSKRLARARSTTGTTAPPTDVSTPGRFNSGVSASGAAGPPAADAVAAVLSSVIDDDADLGPSIMEQAAAWEASVPLASEMTQELLKEDASISEIVDYRLRTDSPPPLRPISKPSGIRLPARKFDLKALINMRR